MQFLDFRDALFPASGFQSLQARASSTHSSPCPAPPTHEHRTPSFPAQFRLVENTLGLRRDKRCAYGEQSYCSFLRAEHAAVAEAAEGRPSILQLIQRWLERTPFLECRVDGDGVANGDGHAGSSNKSPNGARAKSPAAGDGADIARRAAAAGHTDPDAQLFSFWNCYSEAVERMIEADRAYIYERAEARRAERAADGEGDGADDPHDAEELKQLKEVHEPSPSPPPYPRMRGIGSSERNGRGWLRARGRSRRIACVGGGAARALLRHHRPKGVRGDG